MFNICMLPVFVMHGIMYASFALWELLLISASMVTANVDS